MIISLDGRATSLSSLGAFVSGTVMVADLLTKAVARAMFVELMRLLAEYSRSGQSCPS